MAGEPTINPYAPPAASIDGADGAALAPGEDRFDRPLFSARQVGVAAFFGSVFAGVLLLQWNFRVMRQPSTANKTLGLGLLASLALIALLMALPRPVSTPVNIAVAFALNKMAASWQGDAFFKHTIAGGARRSNWVVFGIIMATFAGLMVGTMAVFLAFGAFD
jgi:hypothetical protein